MKLITKLENIDYDCFVYHLLIPLVNHVDPSKNSIDVLNEYEQKIGERSTLSFIKWFNENLIDIKVVCDDFGELGLLLGKNN